MICGRYEGIDERVIGTTAAEISVAISSYREAKSLAVIA